MRFWGHAVRMACAWISLLAGACALGAVSVQPDPAADPVPSLLALDQFAPDRVLLEEERCETPPWERRQAARPSDADVPIGKLLELVWRHFGRDDAFSSVAARRVLDWCESHVPRLPSAVQALPAEPTVVAGRRTP